MLRYKHATDAIHFDDEKRIAYFKPYDPNDLYPPIIQNNQELIGYHHVSKSAIEDVAHEFNKDVRIIGIDHTNIAKSSLVENFIVRGSYKFPKSNYTIPDGSWIVGIKMESDELWDKAKTGQIKGISPAGHYIDRYYDDNRGKWIINKLNCKELSLVINRVPDNKTPMLYLHAKKGEENMPGEENKNTESGKKESVTFSDIIQSKYEQTNSSEKEKRQNADTPEQATRKNPILSDLSENIKQNTEALKRLDPNYEKNQAILERKKLIDTLRESKDPVAKSILAQLQKKDGESEEESRVVDYGFDMDNLQTVNIAEAQGISEQQTSQDANIQQSQIPKYEQKKSPDVFINPDENLKQKQQKGKPAEGLPKNIAEKANALDKKYEEDRTLNPWDKWDEQMELASQL